MSSKSRARAANKKIFQWEISSKTHVRPAGVLAASEGSGCQGDAPSCQDSPDNGPVNGDCVSSCVDGDGPCTAAWLETPISATRRPPRGRRTGR